MDCDDLSMRFTNRTSTYVVANAITLDGSHVRRHWLGRTQPVTVIVSRCKIAHIVQIAEHIRHRAEATETTARTAQVLSMGSKHYKIETKHFS